jgi:hypothetical protein
VRAALTRRKRRHFADLGVPVSESLGDDGVTMRLGMGAPANPVRFNVGDWTGRRYSVVEVPAERSPGCIALFGDGLAYYVVGLLTRRAPDASVWQIVAMAAMFALPLVVLLSPETRAMFAPFPPRAGGY